MKIFLVALLISLYALISPSSAYATNRVAGHSAELVNEADQTQSHERKVRVDAIARVLTRNNSPMIREAENFVIVADALNLDPYMLPAIAGVESGFGRAMIQGTHNPFGWNVGRTPFPSWSDGIAIVGSALRYKYIDRGADSLDAIAHKYAGGSTTWAPKVRAYIVQFEREEAKIRRMNML